ncbi:hypothetical protein Poli38472_004679 [Pythium oligandrum]|uniref:Uncharacterized protein n=1 Tax=Pythium oligandrum TaxID=41045 RepID=A0A8K1FDN5_PYTOL|nr:hypothetical protein Poli38472_004679 [Pythium oligandrum]|eukprot:TMW59610.1 hypothetical protein Poli38472_004679 [Pythium oligandrum]
MTRSPDNITKIEGYHAAAEAQIKCEVLRRAGLPEPADLLKAADEELYESGKPIADAFETRMREVIEQQGIDEVENAIALMLYSGDRKFDETILALIYLIFGGAERS